MAIKNLETKLRVVDRHGHTLCYFNKETLCIEIKVTRGRGGISSTNTYGELYAINIEQLLSASQESPNSPEPVFVFIAKHITETLAQERR